MSIGAAIYEAPVKVLSLFSGIGDFDPSGPLGPARVDQSERIINVWAN
jgi:hypothetical protein